MEVERGLVLVHHREQRLVCMDERLHAVRRVKLELRACLAKAGFVLRCCKDGYVEDLTCVCW